MFLNILCYWVNLLNKKSIAIQTVAKNNELKDNSAVQKNAIISIAPKSSNIASAIKNIFKDVGTLFPKSDNTPKANAISVAVGIAQPLSAKSSP